jgi:hypothetical protein
VSGHEWEILARIAAGSLQGAQGVCRELSLAIGAERLFCVVNAKSRQDVYGFDYEGYPVTSAESRLPMELIEQSRAASATARGSSVIRRAALDVRGAALVAAMHSPDLDVFLVLEHRFAGAQLSAIDERDVARWVTLCAVAERARRDTGPDTLRPPPGTDAELELGNIDGAQHAAALEPEEVQLSLSALEDQAWNISRAARQLGITRHGLKKRMRRLGIQRPQGIADPEGDS